MRILIEDDRGVVLEAVSDEQARYKITGRALRDNVKEYETDDDLHVVGLFTHQLNAYNSMEYLRRRLAEHDAEVIGDGSSIEADPKNAQRKGL
jgi:hypothetical protein